MSDAGAGIGRGRLWQIDAVRGLMLVLMTLTHVPTRFSSPAGQPFGYVSAAEGFVLLSAFMAGWIYTGRQLRDGVPEMRSAFLKRVLKLYLSQTALLLFLYSAFALIGLIAHQDAAVNLVSFYLQHPADAFVGSLLLVYNPPLLDILPMYILFMLGSAPVLVAGHRHGWRWLLGASAALWVTSQLGFGRWLYGAVVSATDLAIPFGETGAFEILAWQMVWMVGLWMGASYASRGQVVRFPAVLVASAVAVGVVGFVWRHAVGQAAFPGNETLNLWFDKWRLGPLRALNLAALVVLAMRFEPWLTKHVPRIRLLEVLGGASLPVFCAHLVIALLVLATLGDGSVPRPWAEDIAILGGAFALLCLVGLVSRRIDRHAARVRQAYAGARAARLAEPPLSAGDRRSRFSRSSNPRR